MEEGGKGVEFGVIRGRPMTLADLADVGKTRERLYGPTVRREDGCLIRTCAPTTTGYTQIRVRNADGSRGIYLAHRIAVLLDEGELDPWTHVAHLCDTPRCVAVEHLRPGTQQENMDARNGRMRQAYGERNANARMTGSEVVALRRLPRPQLREFAREHGLGLSAVRMAWRGDTWTHIPMPQRDR